MSILKYEQFIQMIKNKDFLSKKGILKLGYRTRDRILTYQGIQEELKNITSFASNISLNHRLKLIIHNITEDNYGCPVCSNSRKFNASKSKWFLTCNLKNEQHTLYLNKISKKNHEDAMLLKYNVKSPAQLVDVRQKMQKTCLARYGVANPFQLPETIIQNGIKWQLQKEGIIVKAKLTYIKTCKNKYSVKYESQKNIKNYNNLKKTYIESNFIDSMGHIMITEICRYYQLQKTAVYKYIKILDIDVIYQIPGFNPDRPAILYYIFDPESNMYKIGITNNDLNSRFGKRFLIGRSIQVLQELEYKNGADAYTAEQEILEAFSYARCVNDTWPEAKGGKTEFFNRDILGLKK